MAALLLAWLSGPSHAQEREARYKIQYREAPIHRVISDLSKRTGRRFLYDPETVRGRITITGYERVTGDEWMEILHAALLVNNYVVLPAPGDMLRIVPLGRPEQLRLLNFQENSLLAFVRPRLILSNE